MNNNEVQTINCVYKTLIPKDKNENVPPGRLEPPTSPLMLIALHPYHQQH